MACPRLERLEWSGRIGADRWIAGRLGMVRRLQVNKVSRRRTKAKVRTKKKDPIFVDGKRPRPMFVDYKDVELLKKLTNRQGKIINRRKSGCTAVSQHAVTTAIKRARFMALLPYTGE
jgi:small subunit ribosomal protein S18